MELKLIRTKSNKEYTEGKLYINGVFFCDTLEDKDRGLDQSMSELEINKKKIYGETAIPIGTYKVILSYSPRFKRILPEVLNVKGFIGIRIHNGSFAKDTFGCPLVGKKYLEGFLTDSKKTTNALIKRLEQEKNITLTINY